MKTEYKNIKQYLLLWSTQSLSSLGSGMTGYALVLWLYQNSGSALKTALLSICTYAPYVIMSIFAGALSDRWNKKAVMLICDLCAAVSTAVVFVLVRTGSLVSWHLYIINAVNGLMNTVQRPASEVAATLLVPKEYYQKTSGLRSFSQSLNSILTPVIATALFSFAGIGAVIATDLLTFFLAFVTLWAFVKIPKKEIGGKAKESLIVSVRTGLVWIKENRLIGKLIMFLACINLVASAYDASLPAMILPRTNGGETALGLVNTCVGIATLLGSVLVTIIPEPESRVRAICAALFVSMSTENFLLAFGRTPLVWCIGAVLGWIFIPIMNANMDVIFRTAIPTDMQGRVYSCRNTMQFITIPIGLLMGGELVDKVFEPFMAARDSDSILLTAFGTGKGSGAAVLFFVIGIAGVIICAIFSRILKAYK